MDSRRYLGALLAIKATHSPRQVSRVVSTELAFSNVLHFTKPCFYTIKIEGNPFDV